MSKVYPSDLSPHQYECLSDILPAKPALTKSGCVLVWSDRNTLLIFDQQFSIGENSGEYGGKMTFAPAD